MGVQHKEIYALSKLNRGVKIYIKIESSLLRALLKGQRFGVLDEWKFTQVYIHLQASEFGLFATFGGKKAGISYLVDNLVAR